LVSGQLSSKISIKRDYHIKLLKYLREIISMLPLLVKFPQRSILTRSRRRKAKILGLKRVLILNSFRRNQERKKTKKNHLTSKKRTLTCNKH
jgi:hypothetical protein